MDDTLYKTLKYVAIILAISWLGWSAYDSLYGSVAPGDTAYQAAERYFEDAKYQQAIEEYNNVLTQVPQHLPAMRGKARALLQLEHYPQALSLFNEVISRDPQFAASYANRGILHDRMGHYQQAIQDYEQAIRLDAEITEGPNWLTRFLRLQDEKPPTIADRARYLKEQLAKPESERVLRVKELDEQQRSYKM